MFTHINDLDRMFGALDLFRNRMGGLFSDFDRSLVRGWAPMETWPRTNLYDAGDNIEVWAEVPGLSKDDLTINVQGNYLQIKGEEKAEVPEGYTVHRQERGSRKFSRSFTLPTEIDVEKVEAKLKDGILVLTMPKAEAAKPKQIAIN